ncbi:2,3-butanediol dehydrogenase [Thioclava sp. GXIMD4215]|uniref:2,3-butanediol dehydrogenase n=1 Tax=Thioclava sp. GXIMD4215 TaxID=3131928 RepID=UPI00311B30AA
MKALRFHAAKDLRVEDIEDVAKPGPGQVAVKNRFAGICGTDLHEYVAGPIFVPSEPHPFTKAVLPQVLGHEFGGTVTAVGEGVTHVKVGDRISCQPLVMPRSGDYFADRGLFHLSEDLALVGLSWNGGGFSEAVVINDYNAVKIPDTMSDEEAALVEPTAVAVYAAERGEITAGDSVLVTGAGPIGMLSLLAAKAYGATKVFLSDVNETRLKMAKEILPEVITLNPMKDDVVARIREATEGGVGCDKVIEASGNEAALNTGLQAVRKQGTIVQVGLHTKDSKLHWHDVTFKDVDVRGAWAYPTYYWPKVIDLIATGAIPASKIVTKKIKLDDAVKEGFDALLDPAGNHLKILIDLEA